MPHDSADYAGRKAASNCALIRSWPRRLVRIAIEPVAVIWSGEAKSCRWRSADGRFIKLERDTVRLAPNGGARADIPGPPLWANNGRFSPQSITSSAVVNNVAGNSSPSDAAAF